MAEVAEIQAEPVVASPLLTKIQEMLNEEKWTRAALSNYSTGQFKELDVLLKEAREGKSCDDLKQLCDDHLIHTKNSIIALYLSGMIALSRQLIDDAVLVNLVTIFVDNRKWGIVRYLCERVLDYGESKFALRTLAECYKNENEEDLITGIWERLVKVDYEEADISKALAEHYEKLNNAETAVDYYKKALHRYINKGLFTNVREIWTKLIEFCPEDIDFFLHVEKRIAKNISSDKAALLLQDVFASCKKRGEIDTAIGLLKLILQYNERDSLARREITECFRLKYADHSQLEEYIRLSNLTQNWRNVKEAITDFEKHIAFDKGNFVFHRTWGVGRIASMQGDEITVDFAKKRNHSMSLKMAVNALQTLSKNHIWVLKATWKKEKLHEQVKSDHAWALKTVIKSFGNFCDLKRIKAELVPSVLSAGEWTGWTTKAREILKTDSTFGVSPDNIDLFTVRDRPISIEEKLYNEFKAQKNFFDRINTIRDLEAKKEAELDSELFNEMFNYFTGYLRSYSQINEQVIASYLLVKEMAGRHPHLGKNLQGDFQEIFNNIEDLPALFLNLKDPKIKEEFLLQIKLTVDDWADIYVRLFPYAMLPSIISSLEKEGYEEKLVGLIQNCFENYRDYREAVVWFHKNVKNPQWFTGANITEEKKIITLIYILDITYRDIDNHRNTVENRKTNKQVYTLLFKDGLLESFILKADEDTLLRIYTLIEDVKDLDPADKFKLRGIIQEKDPNFKFTGETEKRAFRGLMVTAAKYEEKQRHLAHIMDEEVPANSKEIAFALSLGDLRENAEYKAAKEKQEILNSTVAKLKDEIERAQLFDPATVNTDRISFGTRALLVNIHSREEEEYTILGPWESDPENHIISYLSPFGSAMLNKRIGEQFEFFFDKTNRDEKFVYTVKEITKVPV
ncbi:MAG: transcription elongation factor GreA [Spirochaetaceae bacterium]|jgi:transcription elongation factor GreA|nr:transcription elongation factor GreA [Spirochaetaceae bacterium]